VDIFQASQLLTWQKKELERLNEENVMLSNLVKGLEDKIESLDKQLDTLKQKVIK
jgi:predicted RNase H-like nuclease (RuvC/YqgF family)